MSQARLSRQRPATKTLVGSRYSSWPLSVGCKKRVSFYCFPSKGCCSQLLYKSSGSNGWENAWEEASLNHGWLEIGRITFVIEPVLWRWTIECANRASIVACCLNQSGSRLNLCLQNYFHLQQLLLKASSATETTFCVLYLRVNFS